MSQEHSIILPDELVEQWRIAPEYFTGREKLMFTSMTTKRLQEIANQATQWGADKQLVICLKWLQNHGYLHAAADLKKHCRPKSLSLKEQALALIRHDPENQPFLSEEGIATIRRALESLPEEQ